jgi:hypothetical protein
MAKRAQVQPDWLDDMLRIWGKTSDKQTGWYGINPMLKSGIPTKAASYEPTGYCAHDFRQLEKAMESLEHRHKVVLVMHYKPAAVRAAEEELKGYGMPRSVWIKWLHEAASLLAAKMGAMSDAA